ncbi:MAG: hypothetical protein K0Q95_2979 [Bacteroidota bacterium]|jgi:hypothetical protein|nr:hypothetical protein [Bacteroidota bacterium]
MKKFLLFISITASIAGSAQNDTIKRKIDSVQVKIDKLEDVKETLKAADTIRYWKKGGLVGLNFSQASFTNWAAGGVNSVSLTGITNLFANYKKGNNSWDNTLVMAYGLIQSGHEAPRKNEDKIDFTSTYGRLASKHWSYAVMLNFKSQFDDSYNFPDDSNVIAHFLAPAYVLLSLGMEYKSDDKAFTFLISPLTSKTTIVNDQRLANAGAFGVEPAERNAVGNITKHAALVRYELGGFIKMLYKKEIAKNVLLATKVELFSNYLKNPQNIDVNWEFQLDMKINKYLAASLSTQMIYDHDIPVPVERTVNNITVPGVGPRLQFKEVLAIGIAYNF